MSIEALPEGLAAEFRHFIGGLCDVVAAYIERARSAVVLIVAIIAMLRQRQDRFLAILARFKAGTLRAPSLGGIRRAHNQGASSPHAPDPVPPCRAYLVRLLKHEAAVYGRILEILLADPEMVALLAASPQAGRLLRPLWRTLNLRPLPAVLQPQPHAPAASLAEAEGTAPTQAVPPTERTPPQAAFKTPRPARVSVARRFGAPAPIPT